jgi:hypothetical protein
MLWLNTGKKSTKICRLFYWNFFAHHLQAPLALYIVFVFHLAETNRRDIDKVEKQKSCGEDYVFANSKSTRKRNIEKSVNLHSPINIGCPGKVYKNYKFSQPLIKK